MSDDRFIIDKPVFDGEANTARFTYRLGPHRFTEVLTFSAAGREQGSAFSHLLDITAATFGVSYFKLHAPFAIDASALNLSTTDRALVLDTYENGLGEFYATNGLERFGRLTLTTGEAPPKATKVPLKDRVLLPIGGGKDSLASLDLMERAGIDFTPFAVNPKGPIVSSLDLVGRDAVTVTRTLDPAMIELSRQPGYYNGHVPATAINSMIASLSALLFDYRSIALSNERSANEGNLAFDGRIANHQHSKSVSFERAIANALSEATGGALRYFSLLRPYSEARIGQFFARTDRFDAGFSSCNRNFRLSGHDGPLWCGECPKCHFTFLILANAMPRKRVLGIFGADLLDRDANLDAYRELTGLSGHKPWECVGEILEAAACLFRLGKQPEWAGSSVVATLLPELVTFYGTDRLDTAWSVLMTDSPDHLIPADITARLQPHVA